MRFENHQMHAMWETEQKKRNFELKRRRLNIVKKKRSIELLFLRHHQLMRSITILIIPTLFFSDNYCYQQDIKMRFDPLPNGWPKLALYNQYNVNEWGYYHIYTVEIGEKLCLCVNKSGFKRCDFYRRSKIRKNFWVFMILQMALKS